MTTWVENSLSTGSRELTVGARLPDRTMTRLRIVIFDLEDDLSKPLRFRTHVYIDQTEIFRAHHRTISAAKKAALRNAKRVLSVLLAELARA